MLEIRCSESEAAMQTRGMSSICIAAQRVSDEGWSKSMRGFTDLRKVLPGASDTAGSFGNGLSFDYLPIVYPGLGV